ncbi:MAG: hypothetical protein R3C99_00840 [Pirellulaceae bacterium]
MRSSVAHLGHFFWSVGKLDMRDHGSWSVHLGRVAGVEFRLHMSFLLFAAATLWLGWQVGQQPGSGDFMAVTAAALVVLFVSGFLHELGHVQSALRLGGSIDRVVLGPLAGLTAPSLPADPRAEAVCHLSGPLVNVLVCSVCAPLLWMRDPTSLTNLINPFSPEGIDGPLTAATWIRLAFWINWTMLLLNMLPVFPFDGGRALRAVVMAWRPGVSPVLAARFVSLFAKMTAVLLIVAACLFWQRSAPEIVPAWFVLLLLAILVFFSARFEERRAAAAFMEATLRELPRERSPWQVDDDDEEEPFTAPPSAGPGPVTRWLEERRQQREARQQAMEAEEERRVDEILARVFDSGLDSLSDDDRSLLDRVSARYRERQQHSP